MGAVATTNESEMEGQEPSSIVGNKGSEPLTLLCAGLMHLEHSGRPVKTYLFGGLHSNALCFAQRQAASLGAKDVGWEERLSRNVTVVFESLKGSEVLESTLDCNVDKSQDFFKLFQKWGLEKNSKLETGCQSSSDKSQESQADFLLAAETWQILVSS